MLITIRMRSQKLLGVAISRGTGHWNQIGLSLEMPIVPLTTGWNMVIRQREYAFPQEMATPAHSAYLLPLPVLLDNCCSKPWLRYAVPYQGEAYPFRRYG